MLDFEVQWFLNDNKTIGVSIDLLLDCGQAMHGSLVITNSWYNDILLNKIYYNPRCNKLVNVCYSSGYIDNLLLSQESCYKEFSIGCL